jgi:thiamine transporter
MKKQKNNTLFLVEVAVFSALAFLLDFISGLLSFKLWPQGGSISFAMVPIFLMAFRWGIKGGIVTGFLLGLLQFILGFSQIYTIIQGLIDYGVAFSVVGLAGLVAVQVKNSLRDNKKGKWVTYTVLGVFLGSVLRYLCHVIAGIVFFGEFAPEGQPVAIYSLLYNGTYMLPSFIVSAIIVILVISAAPKRMVLKES